MPFTWFMDEFVDDPQFIGQGKLLTKAPDLQASRRLVSRRIFPDGDHRVRQLMLHDFFHGSAVVSGRITLLFSFRNLGFGMAAFRDWADMMVYSRITTIRQKDRLVSRRVESLPSRHPRSAQTPQRGSDAGFHPGDGYGPVASFPGHIQPFGGRCGVALPSRAQG